MTDELMMYRDGQDMDDSIVAHGRCVCCYFVLHHDDTSIRPHALFLPAYKPASKLASTTWRSAQWAQRGHGGPQLACGSYGTKLSTDSGTLQAHSHSQAPPRVIRGSLSRPADPRNVSSSATAFQCAITNYSAVVGEPRHLYQSRAMLAMSWWPIACTDVDMAR